MRSQPATISGSGDLDGPPAATDKTGAGEGGRFAHYRYLLAARIRGGCRDVGGAEARTVQASALLDDGALAVRSVGRDEGERGGVSGKSEKRRAGGLRKLVDDGRSDNLAEAIHMKFQCGLDLGGRNPKMVRRHFFSRISRLVLRSVSVYSANETRARINPAAGRFAKLAAEPLPLRQADGGGAR